MAGAERDPHLAQPDGRIEIGQRVELHGFTVPGGLDPPAQCERHPVRLVRVPGYDFVIEFATPNFHRRDQSRVYMQKRPPGCS